MSIFENDFKIKIGNVQEEHKIELFTKYYIDKGSLFNEFRTYILENSKEVYEIKNMLALETGKILKSLPNTIQEPIHGQNAVSTDKQHAKAKM